MFTVERPVSDICDPKITTFEGSLPKNVYTSADTLISNFFKSVLASVAQNSQARIPEFDLRYSTILQTPLISVSYNCYIHFDSHSQKLPFGDASFNREHNHI